MRKFKRKTRNVVFLSLLILLGLSKWLFRSNLTWFNLTEQILSVKFTSCCCLLEICSWPSVRTQLCIVISLKTVDIIFPIPKQAG